MTQKKAEHNLKNIGDIIYHYNLLIFDEKIWKGKGLWKVTEVTYSYEKNTNINETLFVHLGGLDIDKFISTDSKSQEKILKKSKNNVEKIIQDKIKLINEVLLKLQDSQFQNTSEGEKIEKEIFESAVIEKLNLLEYCLVGLDFEFEKAGGKLDITEEKLSGIEKNLSEIDSSLYGGLIRDNESEIIISYEYLYGTFLKKRSLFSTDQCEKYESYLEKVKKILPKNYQFIKKGTTSKIPGAYLHYHLQRADYILAFNMLIDAFGTMNHIVRSDINAGSISDGPEGVYFPMNEKFNTITIERFFKLGMHEIETHSVTDHNSRGILGNLRGSNSTKKDEGTAILMEQLFLYGRNILSEDMSGKLYIDKNKLQINGYLGKTLMGELLSNSDFLDFLQLSEIIDPDIIPPIERYKRLKRNNKNCVQHKDTTYTRGLLQAVNEINLFIETNGKKGLSPEDLFIGKISFEETLLFKKLKEIKQKNNKVEENLKPIFVSDAVYYVIEKRLQGLDDHINSKDFLDHLHYKYPLFDFIKDIDAEIYFKKNSRIIGISNVLLKIISNKKVENIFESADDRQKKLLEKIFQTQYQPLINDVHEDLALHRRNHK